MTRTNYGLSLEFFIYNWSAHGHFPPGQGFEHVGSHAKGR